MQAVATERPWIERLIASPRVRATYASTVAHVFVLLVLGLLVIPLDVERPPTVITLSLKEPVVTATDERGLELGGGAEATGGPPTAEPVTPDAYVADAATRPDPATIAVEPAPPPIDLVGEPPAFPAPPRPSPQPEPAAATSATRSLPGPGDAFAGRRAAGRGAGVAGRGGSAASEAGGPIWASVTR